MRKEFTVVALVGFCGIGAAIYGSRDRSDKTPNGGDRIAAENSGPGSSNSGTMTQDASSQQQIPPAPSRPGPPPPPPGAPSASPAPPEPERSLSDAAKEYVTWVERYLPSGSQVYTYPVDSHLEAAVISTDLDGDGVPGTVVVFTARKPTAEEGSLPLMLGVMASDGDKKTLRLRASTHLAGNVLLSSQIEGISGPLSMRSVTGKNRPEIIVISGVGASIGWALQVFSYNRSGLTEIAHIDGHFFRVRNIGQGKPAVITARSRFEQESRVYEFKGDKFQETGRIKR